MIKRHNAKVTALALLALVLSLLSLALAYLFFRWAGWFVTSSFKIDIETSTIQWISVAAVGLIFILGLIGKERGQGHRSLEDSDLSLAFLGSDTGGAHMVGHYSRRVTGPAYILSQLFLAGSLQFWKSYDYLRSRIPYSIELENRLASTVEFAQQHKGWHAVSDYAENEAALSLLIRMGIVEYSGRKGRVKLSDKALIGLAG